MPEFNNPDKTIQLSSFVHIRQNGIRSINIERDLFDASISESYLLTAQSRSSLGRIINQFNGGTPTRAWTLTGPYGSGKSFFGLYLMNLLCKTQQTHKLAEQQLREKDLLLFDQFSEIVAFNGSMGLLPVPVMGYRASIQECLKHGLVNALEGLGRDNLIQPYFDELRTWTGQTESRAIVQWLQKLLSILTKPPFSYKGMFLVFDELGKAFEYIATHSDTTDIYLLQEIAECANRSGSTPLVLLGILHQGFERYAVLLDSTTQREWAKVQGRFADIPFQEPPHLQMRLIANAIEYANLETAEDIKDIINRTAENTGHSNWRPTLISKEEFTELSRRSYPLHPSTLVALPYLFRRLAQNERSIFAYLASQEPFGFQDFLHHHNLPEFIRIPDLFDYLSANFQGRLYASGRARILTETLELLEKSTNLSTVEAELIKTIGLLTWLGEVSHIKSTETNVIDGLRSEELSDEQVLDALRTLQARSIIVYRRFNQTYSIWQGSDVDIEDRLEQAQKQLTGAFSLAEAIQRYLPPRPIIARRHSYQTGTLRYFEVRYVGIQARNQLELNSSINATGRVLLCLPTNASETELFQVWAKGPELRDRSDVVIGIAGRISRLIELLYELRCLYWVRENTPELRDDPVARHELRARTATIEALIQSELDRSINLHRLSESSGCQWFYKGKVLEMRSSRGLSHLVSDICDQLYPCSPRIWNELINRRSLSSQAAAARRNLIEAMLTRGDQPALGIQGFPPERSMYESLLNSNGIHNRNSDGSWALSDIRDDPLNLRPVWDVISSFIFDRPPEPRPVVELFEKLVAPPYGLTESVLPVFLCAFLIVHQNETTLYSEGSLLPEPGIADWEVLLRRPELFQIAGCRITGPRAAIVERFARGMKTEQSIMPVVRGLVRRIKSLPEYTLRTRRLSAEAIAVRHAIDNARSPERLLFHDLPVALGQTPFDNANIEYKEIEIFFDHLNTALQDLATASPNLQDWARDRFLESCGLSRGEDGWKKFLKIADELAPRAMNPSLAPLIQRAAGAGNPQVALESVIAFIANRPLRAWTDADADRYSAQVQYIGELLSAERNVSLARLPAELRARSREIAAELSHRLDDEYRDNPRVLHAALQLLVNELQSKLEQ